MVNVDNLNLCFSCLSDMHTILPTSSIPEVQQWFQKVCGLPEEHLQCLEGMNGTALFAYENDIEKLVDHTEVPTGIARKIVFLRDHPDFQSDMLMWNVEKVTEFIQSVVPGQNLSKLSENQIDGPALLSYENEDQIRHDLNVKKLIAFQIYVSVDDFLKKERKSESIVGEVNEFMEDGQMHTVSPQNKDTGKRDSEDQRPFSSTSTTTPQSCGAEQKASSAAGVPLKSEDPFTVYKLFFQNKLRLQPLQDSTAERKQLKECELRVLFHKRKDLNKLEEQFIFLMLCKTESCRGRSAKEVYTKLWKMIQENIPATWSALLPGDVRKRFRFEKDWIYYEEKPISFGDQMAKILSVTEYQKTVKNIDEYSTPVLIIDKQLLDKDGAGYCVTLKVDKVIEEFRFGFGEDVLYWFFDSSDFGSGFKTNPVESSMLGNLPRCYYHDVQHATSKLSGDQRGSEIMGSTSTSSETVSVCPRSFKKKQSSYGQGILSAIETGDNLLSIATEFKFQAGCPPQTDTAFQSFLYKSYEFICGCLNARKNGTIYFGIAERSVRETVFRYGEIHGIKMNKKLCADYYDAFHDHLLQQCFPACFETVKLCVSGPHFILIRNTDERYVIEVDVEPSFSQTKGSIFQFFPGPIFDKYGHPKKHEKSGPGGNREKHVYLKNKDHWTGVFRRDGSSTRYLGGNRKLIFEKIILPDICTKRDQEERREWQAKLQLLNSPEAETLKQFMAECGTSMFPIPPPVFSPLREHTGVWHSLRTYGFPWSLNLILWPLLEELYH